MLSTRTSFFFLYNKVNILSNFKPKTLMEFKRFFLSTSTFFTFWQNNYLIIENLTIKQHLISLVTGIISYLLKYIPHLWPFQFFQPKKILSSVFFPFFHIFFIFFKFFKIFFPPFFSYNFIFFHFSIFFIFFHFVYINIQTLINHHNY